MALYAGSFLPMSKAADWIPSRETINLSSPYLELGYFQRGGLNQSVQQRQLSIGGTKYQNGLGLHANSELLFQLDGNVQDISGAAGIDDETENRGSVTVIISDETNPNAKKELWNSGVLTSGKAAKPFSVSLKDVKLLRISVTDAKDGVDYDHADIVNLKMTYTGKQPVQMKTTHDIATKSFSWSIKGGTGGTVHQSVFGGRGGGGRGGSKAIATYPVRGLSQLIEPSLYIIQEDGTHNLDLQSTGKKTRSIDDNATETTFQMKDPLYPVNVDLIITTYANEDVITSAIRVKNNGQKNITLLNRDSAFVNIPHSNDMYLTSFYGNWGSEMTSVREDKLPNGITKHVNSGISRVAIPDYPGCYISYGGKAQEDSGEVFAAAVAWSGSWEYSVANADGRSYFTAGTLPSPRVLKPGEVYESPDVIMTYSRQGKGQASRNLHDYARKYGLYNGETERPIVLNSWEGVYMNFNEQVLTELIQRAASIGAEYFVLDDGWFANGRYARNSDRTGLGDWQVNKQKLPHGIEYLCDECEKNGIKFGLWVEPEMICPVSALFEAHPEYAIQLKGRNRVQTRNQYNIDLSNEEVENFVYKAVADILKEHPRIHYIKWDHNSSANANPGSPAHPDDQGAFNDRLSEAYYRIMAKLRKNFPNVIFQACGSGGMRGDWGALHYNEEFWGSDETNAISRIAIQWGWSHFFPPKAIASHIGKLKQGDFKLRADVAMTARLGIELDPKTLNPQDTNVLKQGIATYKQLRTFLHSADYYRGRSPHESQTTEITFVGKDKKRAVFFGFKRNNGEKTENLIVKGIDANTSYKVTELNKDSQERIKEGTYKGADLLQSGINVVFPNKPSSVVINLEAI